MNNPFINRELSWLEFNGRVLEEAADRTLPLVERLKFLAIVSNNLDEFFMVRVAGLQRQAEAGGEKTDPAGMDASDQLARIRAQTIALQRRQYALLEREILPGLRQAGVMLLAMRELKPAERDELKRYFEREVLPVLTPMAVDPSHPFPYLASGALEMVIRLRLPGRHDPVHAFVEVPRVLPRFVPVRAARKERGANAYVCLGDLILAHLNTLFPEGQVVAAFPFRITRDMDFSLDEEGVADLLQHLRRELRHRRRRDVVRLELPAGQGGALANWLRHQLEVGPEMVYPFSGPLNLADFFPLIERERRPDLVEPDWPPLPSPLLPPDKTVFAAVHDAGAILLCHPFEAFAPVVRLLEEAADDPAVLAIKQTLYRVGGDSPVIRALQRAAENGKQVTVIVEIKARFDEERNIQWAHSLEQSGAHVVYGIVGLKIHAKALLIVRREEGRLVRYLHLATGNYNDKTARAYTDIGLLTQDPDLCADVASLFNVMTGYSQPPVWRKIAAAPFALRQTFLDFIAREARQSSPHHPGHIVAKMNSLVDPQLITALLAAAQAGVRIELIVRGICCLRPDPALPNLSVISVIDRFLEHSRIYYFANGGQAEYYLSSADWMPRNLDRRIEILFPVEDETARATLDTLLRFALEDRRKGRRLLASGRYTRGQHRFAAARSQRRAYEFFAKQLATAKERQPTQRPLVIRRTPPEVTRT